MSATREHPLETPLQYLTGVGPDRAELLGKLKLRRAADLLFFFPRAYEDFRPRSISELVEGETATVVGVLEEVEMRNTGPGKSILGALVRQEQACLRAIWFNQPFMRQKLHRGQTVSLQGVAKNAGGRWEMTHPRVEPADGADAPSEGLLPVYPLTEGVTQPQMRRIISAAVESRASEVEETLPDDLLDAWRLWPIQVALRQIHQPADAESLEQARRRFVFQELLILQLALAMQRSEAARLGPALPLEATAKLDARIRRLFPFQLTADQERAITDLQADLSRETPMNRLLQGDVGTGKTIVAAYAILLAVAHGGQAALLAPTEILARQHLHTFSRLLRGSRVRIGLLTAALSASERRQRLADLQAGVVDLLVGTQSVLSEEVAFAKLTLAVIDEQHRFGVRQRARLKRAGVNPHYLVMSATPIPRTMTLALLGDLDVSVLRERPPGQQPVRTYWARESDRANWWKFVREKLDQGRQAYVVAPVVGDGGDSEQASVESLFEVLANGPLEAYRLGILHGRMNSAEKQQAMDAFVDGETQALVTTSLIEVGVDVPNATVMTIDGGHRFGLAQLHQLRGRVRRGQHPGAVGVFADPQSKEARERLEAFVRSDDGFELAEIDFRLRGPGDVLGARQHGLPPLRVADLLRDEEILAEARQAAREVIAADPDLTRPGWERLRRMVLRRYGEHFELGDVG